MNESLLAYLDSKQSVIPDQSRHIAIENAGFGR
jgi:hypothetical protein